MAPVLGTCSGETVTGKTEPGGIIVLSPIPRFAVSVPLWAAQVIADEPVGRAVLNHKVGHVGFTGIHKTRDEAPTAIAFGDRMEVILCPEALQATPGKDVE